MVRNVIQRDSRREPADPATAPTVPTPQPGQPYPGQRYPYPPEYFQGYPAEYPQPYAQPYPRTQPYPQGQPPAPEPPRYQPRRPRRWSRWFLPHIPRWARLAALLVVVGLVFRRAVAWAVLAGLSGALHLIGVNVHLPDLRFGWPWQSITAGTTTNTLVGPLVLQKIEGISRPALGTENFNFLFTHEVSKSIGPWPCWYSATFYAVGRASATVDLNPGPSWWKSGTGHYQLRVLRQPTMGVPGKLAITMALPLPQLPQSVHDVTVDNTLSKPVSSDHSWTYPGLGCGVLLQPQFSQSVLYAQAQSTAFAQATHLASVTRPLIGAAENEATTMIRDNFLQPTVNALGYTLTQFSIRWVSH
ncbi:MAG TPA: hypothetical protein VKG80_17105 [Trebonia sp.]|nr:hypothetical protein [Trebonia sp.]